MDKSKHQIITVGPVTIENRLWNPTAYKETMVAKKAIIELAAKLKAQQEARCGKVL